ncbi:hypothetical protein KOR42_31200 [Thalassoglobus neptunius]|uniref:Uncharacterized protein n=1 Tax=Thalassoglobus neptunius TaxID=1938619 RepID=A0A5C5WPS5_9PLAN|nr:hypothetical protein KOR42_31200 [Thalassoglobus neptunius]
MKTGLSILLKGQGVESKVGRIPRASCFFRCTRLNSFIRKNAEFARASERKPKQKMLYSGVQLKFQLDLRLRVSVHQWISHGFLAKFASTVVVNCLRIGSRFSRSWRQAI